MNRFFFVALIVISFPFAVSAQNSNTLRVDGTTTSTLSTTPLDAARPADGVNKTQDPEKDIDKEITDARLRTQLGSKSKWSFKSTFTYSGSSVSDPFNGVRPNYRSAATVEEMTSLKGTVGMNYRMNVHDSLSAGTGITMIDPLHGDPTQPATDTRTGRTGTTVARHEIATPYLSWHRGHRIGEYQLISGLMYAHATSNDAVKLFNTFGMAYFNQTVQRQLSPKWSFSLNLVALKFIYAGAVEDPMVLAMMRRGYFKRPDISLTLLPYLQYGMSDRYSFRTGFNYFQFNRYEGSEDNVQMEPSQSVGIGVSVTRDIYLFPHIEFTPKNIRSDRTNVALLANINLF